jgi:plastocyanin
VTPERLAALRKLVLIVFAAAAVVLGALPALGASTQTLQVTSFSFEKPTLTITTGDTVVWHHAAEATYSHNVKFDDGSFRNAAPSKAEWTAQRAFDAAGTYTYRCELHGDTYGMKGTIVVEDPPATPTPTAEATPTPTPTSTATAPSTTSPVAEASALVVGKTIKAGRVRGSVHAGPAGARLTVRVRIGARTAGSATRSVAAPGRLAFAVKLDRGARRRLARRGRLSASVRATVRIGDSVAAKTRAVRLR